MIHPLLFALLIGPGAYLMAMMGKLIAQGWRISATDNGWKVLPPREGVRNDNAQ